MPTPPLVDLYWAQGAEYWFNFGGITEPMPIDHLLDEIVLPQVNPAISRIQVDYPASAFPMSTSVELGVLWLKSAIENNNNSSDPEILKPYMLLGYSQGAIVTSEIFKKAVNGTLGAPHAKCLGIWTFGNPERNAGSYVGNSPGGEGILGPGYVLSEVHALETDYANPGDLVTCNTDPLVSLLASAGYNVWGGNIIDLPTIVEEWASLLEGNDAGTLANPYNVINAFWNEHPQPHTEYDNSPALFGGTEPAAQLCWEGINNAYNAWLTDWHQTYG